LLGIGRAGRTYSFVAGAADSAPCGVVHIHLLRNLNIGNVRLLLQHCTGIRTPIPDGTRTETGKLDGTGF
jgi:hypothetical protein